MPSRAMDIQMNENDVLGDKFGELVEDYDRFAKVHPEHKFQIIQMLKNRDGVNVSPALKKVRVGIAVEGAIDACSNRSHQPRAFSHRMSRKIGQQIENYVIYWIACALQLLVFFSLATLCVDTETIMGGDGSS